MEAKYKLQYVLDEQRLSILNFWYSLCFNATIKPSFIQQSKYKCIITKENN